MLYKYKVVLSTDRKSDDMEVIICSVSGTDSCVWKRNAGLWDRLLTD